MCGPRCADGQARQRPIEQARVEARGDGEGELKVASLLVEPSQRARDRREVVGDFLLLAAGQHREHRSGGVKPLRGEKRSAVPGRPREIDQRMTHEGDGDSRLAVERLLEGEDHDHVRDALADRLHPPAAPGPDLRGDVVDDGDAAPLQLAREPEVEVGVVHEDRGGGRVAVHLREHRAEHPSQAPQVTEHLEQAHHRQVADVGEEAAALGPEPVAAEAEHLEGAEPGPQVTDEIPRVEVPRGLTAGHEQPGGARTLGTRWSRSREYIHGRSVRRLGAGCLRSGTDASRDAGASCGQVHVIQ